MRYFTEKDLKDIWKEKVTEKNVQYFNPPLLSMVERKALEERLGVKLPESYIELVTNSQNGGLLGKRNASPVRDSSGKVMRYVKNDFIVSLGITPAHKDDPEKYPAKEALELFYDEPNLVCLNRSLSTGASYETFVLNYLDSGPNGIPSVALIDRRAKKGIESEPKKGNWKYINESFYWELISIAPNFETYIKELTVAPKLAAFEFSSFKELLKKAVEKSFSEIVKAHSKEEIISYGLYIDDLGTMIADAFNTKSHLDSQIKNNSKDSDYYTYFTTEWRYEGTEFAVDVFNEMSKILTEYSNALGQDRKIERFRNRLLDCCVEVLLELKMNEFFSHTYLQPISLSICVSNGSIPQSKLKKIRKLLQ